MRPLSARKGLRNDLGANNCFLNVIIQSLWHRETITPCLLCELEQIFVMYQFAEQPVLDVDRVRLALGETFALGAMNDATETLETILDALHYDTFNRMLLLRRKGSNIGGIHKVEEMSESLRQDAIIWSSSHVDKTDIKDWMELLSTQCHVGDDKEVQQALDLGRIFRLDKSTEVSSVYSFRGLVCYYGRHYVGFFASRSLDEDGVERERWFLFDDTRVKLVGTWSDVRLRIERGGYQPTLLFYERNGIEHDNLEKIATEIHKWWEATADDPDDDNKKDKAVENKPPEKVIKNSKGAPHEVELDGGIEDELLAKMERSVRITQEHPLPPMVPTSRKQLPTSPISLPHRAPQTMPANNGSQGRDGWRDEDIHLHMAHQSAQDTLSRLNGILSSKVKAPASAPVDGRAVLRMAMSQSMRNSVRLRDYTVHRPTEKELDVNPDKIFEDETSTIEEEQDTLAATESQTPLKVYDVRLHASDGGIGLLLDETPSGGDLSPSNAKKTFVVSGFEVNGAGAKLPAEASGAIRKGDILVGINGHMLESEELVHVLEMLLMSPNPVQLKFHRFQPSHCKIRYNPMGTVLDTKHRIHRIGHKT
ncbi:Inactive ubiquitin carboxyl-terminal hydrolase [Phytophthora palmivora]|uniref:Inactive ubiquitin carboxyl-terminal hydrolase n=1 Tax=Phytophthora palmivora TaxID=4796 RepID=A0A2P4XLR4_9STRA|nr:Inactive ubiquitin carboxyl-terminal hydrolase [Phytophthora palmivora]